MAAGRDTITKWLTEIGSQANEEVTFCLTEGRAWLKGADGDVITACCDWDVVMESDSIEGLADLCEKDLADYAGDRGW